MAPTRVLRIIARMNVGGPAVEIAELMRGLDGTSFEQRLLTGSCAPDEADFLQTQAVDVPATRIEGLGRSIRAGGDLRAQAALVREVQRFQPHVIHTHTAKAGVLGRTAARLAGSSALVVHTHHGHLLHGYFGPAKTRAVIGVERTLSRITDRIITVGERVRDDLLNAGIGRPEQYDVIYSGVRIGQVPDSAKARAELGLDPGQQIVTMIGRLTGIKRPDRFLEAVRLLREPFPRAHFLVAGWGDLGAAMTEEIARDRLPVTMLGWRDDLERILAATDIVALTSDNEGTPLSLVQAGLAGRPAVATHVGAVGEVVTDQETGLLVAPDAPSVARALGALLDDPRRTALLGEAARQFARSRFDPASFIAAHERVYRRARER